MKQELENLKKWNTRLALFSLFLVIGLGMLQRRNVQKVEEMERVHFTTAVKLSELHQGYIDQKLFYLEFLVQNGIIDPQELVITRQEKEETRRVEAQKIKMLRAKYHLPTRE